MDTFRTRFEQTLTPSDSKRNIRFPVHVPQGTAQLFIRLCYAPAIVDNIYNMLTLSVFDPSGIRGAGHRHGNVHEVVLSSEFATSGYCPCKILAGEWSVFLDTHMIYSADCEVRLDIWGTDEVVTSSAPVWEPGPAPKRERGWYRGDLHAHTIHSDAAWDVPDLIAWARSRQLDFCTLSDHNTVAPLAQMDAARRNDLLTLGGIELTTFWGHALALGTREWVDWRTRKEWGMPQIAHQIIERGNTFIIAHPMSIGDPYCTGCRWVYADMMPGPARLVEAWNGPWFGEGSQNRDAVPLIYRWLNQGYRLALTAGTDHHGSEAEQNAVYGFNVVLADALTEQEILRAIRAGHLYLSSGPRLELSGSAGDQQAMMGDVLDCLPETPIHIQAQWSCGSPKATLSLIVDGESHAELREEPEGTCFWTLDAADAHWCLLTLSADDGEMLAMTNPIYLDGRT